MSARARSRTVLTARKSSAALPTASLRMSSDLSTVGAFSSILVGVINKRAAPDAAAAKRENDEVVVKAIVYHRYGSPDVLQLEDIEKPTVGNDDVLVRVRAASVNPYDFHFMRGTPRFIRLATGLRRPKATHLGVDGAGEVAAVGGNVTEFRPGDQVFGACRGAFAEYARASQSMLTIKPTNVSFEQAATIPIAGLTALQALRNKGHVQPEQNVLINGASGGVGTFAVQIARAWGAHVTGVCSSRNMEMVRSIGAERVIDYTREDFTKSDRRYDLLLDCIGNHPLSAFRGALTPKGTYVAIGGPSERSIDPLIGMLELLLSSPFVSQRLVLVLAKPKKEDLIVIKELVETGKLTPVIDRRYDLNDVPDAIRYLEAGHARGKVVITVA